MTIYELSEEFQMLKSMMEDPDIDIEVVKATLEGTQEEFHQKCEGYACVMTEAKAMAEAIKAEADRLVGRIRTINNNLDRMKKVLQDAMEATGETKFKTKLFSFNIQNNPASVVIDDITKVPWDFLVPQEPKVDKMAIKEFLKETKVDWAHMEQTRGVRIR